MVRTHLGLGADMLFDFGLFDFFGHGRTKGDEKK